MRRVDEILEAWARGMSLVTVDECHAVDELLEAIAAARARARAMPGTLDGRSLALIATKLDEAEHWAHQVVRIASARVEALKPKGGD